MQFSWVIKCPHIAAAPALQGSPFALLRKGASRIPDSLIHPTSLWGLCELLKVCSDTWTEDKSISALSVAVK